MKKTNTQLVADVDARLYEEWGINSWSIPADRLRDEIAYSRSTSNNRVVVKIPSRSEFSMTMAEAEAVLAQLQRR